MAASFSISVGMSRRTSGSPPVSRTLSIPSVTAIRTNRSISSKLKQRPRAAGTRPARACSRRTGCCSGPSR